MKVCNIQYRKEIYWRSPLRLWHLPLKKGRTRLHDYHYERILN